MAFGLKVEPKVMYGKELTYTMTINPGEPLKGATVTLLNWKPVFQISETTDSAGQVKFGPVVLQEEVSVIFSTQPPPEPGEIVVLRPMVHVTASGQEPQFIVLWDDASF